MVQYPLMKRVLLPYLLAIAVALGGVLWGSSQPALAQEEGILLPSEDEQAQEQAADIANPEEQQLQQNYRKGVIESIGEQQEQGVLTTIRYPNGDTAEVLMLQDPKSQGITYEVGDTVLVLESPQAQGDISAYIVDVIRTPMLIWLAALFAVVVIAVGRFHGFLSIIGMLYSFLIIGQFIVPNIIRGNDPVFISLMGGMLISPVTFYLSHGIKWKTTIAILGTIAALAVTGGLAAAFISLGKLSGADSDEAMFVQTLMNLDIDLRSLLLAGMIIGSLGILDDITVSQAAIVAKLVKTNPSMKIQEVFVHAMDIGRDHITSLVNTLILIYAGASLPLFLLFINSDLGFEAVLSTEIVATEVVRMLVGSIGLVLAVPITTMIACSVFARQKSLFEKQ